MEPTRFPLGAARTRRTVRLTATLALAMAGSVTWATSPAAQPTAGATARPATLSGVGADPATVLSDLQAGRLQAADAALRAWPTSTPDDAARQRRLLALVQQQRQLASQVLPRADADLQQRRLPQAVERYEAALALDDSLAQQPRATALQAARSRLWQSRDAVARCMQPRDAACMDQAVRHARTLAPRDPAVALLALQASAWWQPGQPRQPVQVEGTTSSR